jgi:hypothetical protein
LSDQVNDEVLRAAEDLPDPAVISWDDGDTTDLSGLVRDPAQRVVVAGPPGSGRTTVLALIRAEVVRAAAARRFPPPVLLDGRSWQPDRQPFTAWLIGELQRRYPRTRGDLDPGNGIAEFLVEQGWVFPLLDRIDSVPDVGSSLGFVVAGTKEAGPDNARVLRLRPLDPEQVVARLPGRRLAEHVVEPLRTPRNFGLLSRMEDEHIDHLLELPDGTAVELALLDVACDAYRNRPYWPVLTRVAARLAADRGSLFRPDAIGRETTRGQLGRWFALPAGVLTFLAVFALAVADWNLPASAFAAGAGVAAAGLVWAGGALLMRWWNRRELASSPADEVVVLRRNAMEAVRPVNFEAAVTHVHIVRADVAAVQELMRIVSIAVAQAEVAADLLQSFPRERRALQPERLIRQRSH